VNLFSLRMSNSAAIGGSVPLFSLFPVNLLQHGPKQFISCLIGSYLSVMLSSELECSMALSLLCALYFLKKQDARISCGYSLLLLASSSV